MVTVTASEKGVCQITLPFSSETENSPGPDQNELVPSVLTDHVAGLLTSYFNGERQLFENVPVDLSALTPFRSSVLSLIRSIPYGATRSYGEVAAMAGAARGARAIGGAMATNPVPVIIPCHRVISAAGKLTGFSAAGGLTMKKYLLELECAVFKGKKLFQ